VTDNTPTEPATPRRRTAATRKPVVPSVVPAVVPVEATPVASPVVTSVVTPAVQTTGTATAPAGWYLVAAGSAQQRWWDGTAWTEHVYNPVDSRPSAGAAPAVATTPVLRAPEGVKPDTVWFWLLAIGVPVLQILALIPASLYIGQILSGSSSDASSFLANEFSPAYLLATLTEWFIAAVCIVFAALDWRELKARGVPRPFHWAWSFFVLLAGWPGVYMIGRSVIVRRRTGGGLTPLWIYIALQVVAFVVIVIVVAVAVTQLFIVLGDSLGTAGNVL
jgi:Protein of unknown function (DUF2510)